MRKKKKKFLDFYLCCLFKDNKIKINFFLNKSFLIVLNLNKNPKL